MSNGAVTGAGIGPQPGQTRPPEEEPAAVPAIGRYNSPQYHPGQPESDHPGHPEPDPAQSLEHDSEIDTDVIEVTTGAPLAMLPQRVPRIAIPTAGSTTPGWPAGQHGVGSPTNPHVPGSPEDEEDFWLPIEEVHWDGTPITPTPRRWFGWFRRSPSDLARRRASRPPKPPRHPVVGLAGSLAFALAASFFAWVSAQPMWLAFGHGAQGVAAVSTCTGSGLGRQCRGTFTASDGSYAAWDVRLADVPDGARKPGARVPARMVGSNSGIAYVGSGTSLLHLRWSLGLTLVLLCGAGVGWASGALRLPHRWSRRAAVLVSLAGPLLIAAAFLLVAH